MAVRANEITKHLAGIDFPASRKELEKHAKSQGADDDILKAIHDLPEDKYNTMADVMKAYGAEVQ